MHLVKHCLFWTQLCNSSNWSLERLCVWFETQIYPHGLNWWPPLAAQLNLEGTSMARPATHKICRFNWSSCSAIAVDADVRRNSITAAVSIFLPHLVGDQTASSCCSWTTKQQSMARHMPECRGSLLRRNATLSEKTVLSLLHLQSLQPLFIVECHILYWAMLVSKLGVGCWHYCNIVAEHSRCMSVMMRSGCQLYFPTNKTDVWILCSLKANEQSHL